MFYVLESHNQPYRDVFLCACQYWPERIKYHAQKHKTATVYSLNLDILGFIS